MLVSVIIPTYNRAYCLAASIDSALAQSYQDLEIIVLDDGSTDGTEALVRARYGSDARVRYTAQRNAGVAAARNQAIRLSRGELVAFLDSDDLWEPWKLALQIDVLRRFPEAGMVFTDMDEMEPDGRIGRRNFLRIMLSAYRWYPTSESLFDRSVPLAELGWAQLAGNAYCGDLFNPMIMGNLVYTSSVVLRRDRLAETGWFREDMRVAEDYDFHLRTCRAGRVAFVDVSSTRYQRGRDDQLTRGLPELRVETAKNFFKTVLPILEADKARITLPKSMLDALMSESHEWLGGHLLEQGRNFEAMKHLTLSLLGNPRQPKTYGFLALTFVPPRVARGMRRAYRGAKAALARFRA